MSALQQILTDHPIEDIRLELDRLKCEEDLARFFRECWPCFDPMPFKGNWHLDAIADHLMAVTDGQIKKLLINVPYRSSKTSLINIAYPAWTWAQRKETARSGPKVQFLCLSYAGQLAWEIARKRRRLLAHEWYQARWGNRVRIAKDQDSAEKIDIEGGGSCISSGFDGVVTGRGGTIKIIDDPHKPSQVESELVLGNAITTYDETLTSRFTDPEESAEIVVMQRLSDQDLSGHILDKDKDVGSWVHLMIPMEFDPLRTFVTVLGWRDPRGCYPQTTPSGKPHPLAGEPLPDRGPDGKFESSLLAQRAGALMWPNRFNRDWLEAEKLSIGPFATANQLQQEATARKGGIIQSEWWRYWPRDSTFPDMAFVLLSHDPAASKKEMSSYRATTVWGLFFDDDGYPQIMLKDRWQERCTFAEQVQAQVNLARKHKADILLIENTSNGASVEGEIVRLCGGREFTCVLSNPVGDKIARLLSVQHMFSGMPYRDEDGRQRYGKGVVWAPDTDWAEEVIQACKSFPRTKFPDLVDTVSQAVKFLRDDSQALLGSEKDDEERDKTRLRRPLPPIADV